MKVLVATVKPFAQAAVNGIKEIIESAGFEFYLLEKYADKKQLIDAVRDVDALIVRSDKIDKEVLDAASKLQIVVRAGAGYDNIDLAVAKAHNVCVMNTPGQNSNAVAEMVLGMIIYMLRNGYNGTSGSELKGKTLGLHAFGHVAKLVAKLAKGFGMDVYAYDAFDAAFSCKECCADVTRVNKPEELYEKCDIVSLHMPATPQTTGSINYEMLKRMKNDSLLVNSARKELINEADLVRIMEEKPKFKYVADVRPDNHAEMVEKFGNRYFSSDKKCGAQTAEANINAGLAAARQIVGFLKNGDRRFQVN